MAIHDDDIEKVKKRLRTVEKDVHVAKMFAAFFGIATVGGVILLINAYGKLRELDREITAFDANRFAPLKHAVEQLDTYKESVGSDLQSLQSNIDEAYENALIQVDDLNSRIEEIEYGRIVKIDSFSFLKEEPDDDSYTLRNLRGGENIYAFRATGGWYRVISPLKGYIREEQLEQIFREPIK